jgi:hypothetical protein
MELFFLMNIKSIIIAVKSAYFQIIMVFLDVFSLENH